MKAGGAGREAGGAGRERQGHRCPWHRWGFFLWDASNTLEMLPSLPALGTYVSVIKLSSYPCLLHTDTENVSCNIINRWKYN